MIMKRLLIIYLALCFWGECSYAVEKQKDIEILYNRLLEEYLSDSIDVSQAEKDLAVMQTDGSWKDIDYKTVTFYFDADRHLKRLRNIALAYSKPGNKLFHKPELRKKIVLGLDYFRTVNPDSGNWWYRDIGAPSQYMVPLLLLKKELKREDLMRLSAYLVDKTDNVAHRG